MADKRYYWLKLKEDFFDNKAVKKLRRIAGGDTYTIIYMKMLLLSLRDEGKLYYDGIEETFEEELALTLDEDVENIKVTISYLMSVGLLALMSPDEAELTEIPDLIGSESWSAERVRKHRKRNKMLHCNTDVTACNEEIEIDIEKEKDKEKKEKLTRSKINEEFESLWKLYPKKHGKKNALKYYERARRNGTTYEMVESGIKAYVEHIKTTNTEPNYIKMGSTFFSQESWLDDWTVPGQPQSKSQFTMSDEEFERLIEAHKGADEW